MFIFIIKRLSDTVLLALKSSTHTHTPLNCLLMTKYITDNSHSTVRMERQVGWTLASHGICTSGKNSRCPAEQKL